MALAELVQTRTSLQADVSFYVSDDRILVCSGGALSVLSMKEVTRSKLFSDLLSTNGRAEFPLDREALQTWRRCVKEDSVDALKEDPVSLASLWQVADYLQDAATSRACCGALSALLREHIARNTDAAVQAEKHCHVVGAQLLTVWAKRAPLDYVPSICGALAKLPQDVVAHVIREAESTLTRLLGCLPESLYPAAVQSFVTGSVLNLNSKLPPGRYLDDASEMPVLAVLACHLEPACATCSRVSAARLGCEQDGDGHIAWGVHAAAVGLPELATALARLPGLADLDVSGAGFLSGGTGRVVDFLKPLSTAPALTRLCLSRDSLVVQGLSGLDGVSTALAALTALRSLDLSSCHLGLAAPQAFGALLSRGLPPALEALRLDSNHLQRDHWSVVCGAIRARRLDALRSFSLRGNQLFGAAGLVELADAVSLVTRLTLLDLGENGRAGWGSGPADGLAPVWARCLRDLTSLRRLSLDDCGIDGALLATLAPALVQLRDLEALDLGRNHLRTHHVRVLLSNLAALPRLTRLALADSGLHDCGEGDLQPLVGLTALEALDLSCAPASGKMGGDTLGSAVAVALTGCARPALRRLHLLGHRLSASAEAVATALGTCTALELLELSLGPGAYVPFFEALRACPVLEAVSLALYDRPSAAILEVPRLVHALVKHPSLSEVVVLELGLGRDRSFRRCFEDELAAAASRARGDGWQAGARAVSEERSGSNG